MKVLILLIVTALITPVSGWSKTEKINWSLCKEDIDQYCKNRDSDCEKHECLEKKEKNVSTGCATFNHKIEAKLNCGGHKEHSHSHSKKKSK